MSKTRMLAAAAVAAALVSGTAYAADQTNTSSKNTSNNTNASATSANDTNNGDQAANRDFGKLSKDGFTALRDIRLTRLAIFDGNTNQAKQDIDNAAQCLQRAQHDDAIYTKAESELKTPSGMQQQTSTNGNSSEKNSNSSNEASSANGNQTSTASTTPIKWLPVNGAYALGEDYLATPEKSKAVDSANEQIKQGNHDKAMDTLKLAHVNVVFDVEVAPLQKTTEGVDKAKQLIDNGKYFEANQELKSVEADMRYDVEEFVGTPHPKKVAQSG